MTPPPPKTNNPDTIPTASRHPIAVVSERTGLSQEVLRVWERRYGAVHPTRDASGERLYSDVDVERLRLLGAAVAGGRRIGKVATLSSSELSALVAEDAALASLRPQDESLEPGPDMATLDRAIERVLALDARGLDGVLRHAAALLGVPTFLEQVIAPFMQRIGDEWHAGSITIAEEHLASAVVADLVGEQLRTMSSANGTENRPRLLVGTPPAARHVIGAAMVGATAAADGWQVVFLGAELPANEIVAAARRAGVDAVAVSLVYIEDSARIVDELQAVRAGLPVGVPLIVGGLASQQVADKLSASGILVGDSLAALRRFLAQPGHVSAAASRPRRRRSAS